MPIFQAVKENTTVKRILVLAIHGFKMTVSSVIGLLIDSEISQHQLELCVCV